MTKPINAKVISLGEALNKKQQQTATRGAAELEYALQADLDYGWVENQGQTMRFTDSRLQWAISRLFPLYGLPASPLSGFELMGNRDYILRLQAYQEVIRTTPASVVAKLKPLWLARDVLILEKLEALRTQDIDRLRILHEAEGRCAISQAEAKRAWERTLTPE